MVSEFISVVTNPKQVRKPVPPEIAVQMIRTLLADPGIVLLPAPDGLTEKFLSVLTAHPATRALVYDRQIAAKMMLHGLGSILTYNEADFSGMPGVTAISPSTAVKRLA